MARSARIYVPIDAALFDQDAVVDAGERATYLYIAILCKIKQLESDGVISVRQVQKLAISGWRTRLDALVRTGLLLTEDGLDQYIVPSWSKWNELSHERAARLERDRERKKDSNRNPDGFQTDSLTKQASKQASRGKTPAPPPVENVLASIEARRAEGA